MEQDITAVRTEGGENESLFPGLIPFVLTLTSAVVSDCKSRNEHILGPVGVPRHKIIRRTGEYHIAGFVPGDRRVGRNAIAGGIAMLVFTLTKKFVPATRSRTKTSRQPLVSLGNKVLRVAAKKATN